ncbi:MAG: filamentous hemagglutinin N-terminal domain-containing protein [Cyanobacteria bacterium P01_G01_bin.39]
MSKALFSVQLFFCILGCLFAGAARSQVNPDSTVNTQVNQNGSVAEITGGETRGENLFHSFQDFSVPSNNEAFFNNAANISHIFSRVTGGNISNIDGLIRTNNSNLFLINPAGIMFGAGARLDLGGGSFYGNTADSILFDEGEFSATDLDNPPLLTVNAPIGLNFRDNPAEITVMGDGNGARTFESEIIDTQEALRVDSNGTFSLVGGNLNFEDAVIKTAGGRIELGSVAGGQVNFAAVDNGLTLDYSAVANFGDILLSGKSSIDASGIGGGDIQVAGNNISLTGVSTLTANTLGSEVGGDILIFASESLNISGVENELDFVSGISNRVFPSGSADSGNITIEARNLTIGDRALISTASFGQGNAGNIKINASDSVTLASQGNTSTISANVAADAVGNGGKIDLISSSVNLSNGAVINANTSGQGNAGNINVNAQSTVSLDGAGTGFFTNVRTGETVGNGGEINITTGALTISNQGSLNAASSGQGNAGKIMVNASESIALEGNNPSATGNTVIGTFVSGDMAQGDAGDINLTTGSLSLNNGAGLFTANFANGKAGDLTINAAGNVSFANGATVFVTGAAGGSIKLDATNLSITSGSRFFAGIDSDSGFPEAQGGDIELNLSEDLVMDRLASDELTFITNSNFGIGNPGNIEINARNITFKNGGNIASFDSGGAETVNIGNITLNATGDIIFDGIKSSQVSGISNLLAENSTGNIGEINVTAQNLTITNGAAIQSQVAGIADSGDINLDIANSIKIDGFGTVALENGSRVFPSQIASNVAGTGIGNAGNISISTQNLELSRNGSIDTNILGQGNGGNIDLDAEQITIGKPGDSNISPSSISAEAFGEGNGGNITIDTGSLLISDGGDVAAGIVGNGQGGSININASDTVSVDGTGLVGETQNSSGITVDTFNSVGNAGDIEITTAKLFVTNGAFVSADVIGDSTGNGGSIKIQATELVSASGGGDIEADLFPDATGTGGDLTIETGKLIVSDDSQISTSTLGDGDAGNLTIVAKSIDLSGVNEVEQVRSGLLANALIGDGQGGNINIVTGELNISDGAAVVAGNFPSFAGSSFQPGTGVAGTIDIQANSINLSNEGRIVASTQSPLTDANSKNINLEVTENITLQDNALISAEAFNQGNGGNLSIDSSFIIAFPSNGNGNDIIASAEQGQGGDITINSNLLGIEESLAIDGNNSNNIDASSEFSLDGDVTITTPDTDLIQGTSELPTNVIEPGQTTAQACQSNREVIANNSFVINGKGGIQPEPGLPLNSHNVYLNDAANYESTIPQPIQTDQGQIQPARGIKVTESGKITLTAYRTNNSGDRLPPNSDHCS